MAGTLLEARKTRPYEQSFMDFSFASQEKSKQILVLGLDGAGKTSVLHSLALNRVQHSVAPTRGLNAVCIHTEDSQMEFLESKLAFWVVQGTAKSL